MPLYDFRCTNKKCKTEVFDVFIAMADVHNGCACPDCNKRARRIFDNTPFQFDFKAGFDSGAGQHFDSAKQRDNYADSHGLRRIKD